MTRFLHARLVVGSSRSHPPLPGANRHALRGRRAAGASRLGTLLALLGALVLPVLPTAASAETGFQLGLPGVNIPRDDSVNGLRFSILYGRNDTQRGLDLGFFSLSHSHDRSGAALIFGVSRVTGDATNAVSLGLINLHDGTDTGMNGAFINLVGDTTGAFNTGFVTIARGDTSVDISAVNISESSKAQIGFVNVTKRIDRVQIGFLNMAENGFVPVFPFFNFPKRMADY